MTDEQCYKTHEVIDWDKVLAYLELCEAAYTQIGGSGWFVRNHVLSPLRDRYNKGERTPELAQEINSITL